jgi:hypothetical protein
MGTSLSTKPGYMARSAWRIWSFLDDVVVIIIIIITLLFQPKQCSWAYQKNWITEWNKTPVKKCLFLDNQMGKMDLPVKDLQCTEIYRMIYRKAKGK